MERVIARGGSSSRGLCIFHTGAVGALCSGPTRPARPASPEDAGTKREKLLVSAPPQGHILSDLRRSREAHKA